MSWERFHFNCRMIKRSLEGGLDIERSCERIKDSRVSEEFGAPIKPGSISDTIFRELRSSSTIKKEAVEKAFDIYGKLDFSILLDKSNRLRRVSVYLSYLTITFIFMSAIYVSFVTPAFEDFFESMGTPASRSFIWFSDNWWLIIISIIICLGLSILLSRKVNEMFKFNKVNDTSMIYKYFIPVKLKKKHKKVLWLINLPIDMSEAKDDKDDNYIISHLKGNNYTNSEVASEISILIVNNMRDLTVYSEVFVQRIFVATALLIIFGIFQFLNSAYAPIFMIENAV